MWLLALIVFVKVHLNNSDSDEPTLAALWATGFCNITPQSLLQSTETLSLLNNVLIANTPQLIVSFVYVSYNSLLTSLLISREFTRFSQKRSGLRVTNPKGRQKSTFWLSLPYRFSLPLLACTAALHWSLSQTLYLAEVKVLDIQGQLDEVYSVSCVAWSALGLMILLAISGTMIVAAVVLGCCCRYPAGVPIVQSCSLAISAACHPRPGKEDEAQKLLQYGVMDVDAEGREYVGLSSGKMMPLVDGRDYI